MVPFLAAMSYIEYRYLAKEKQATFFKDLIGEWRLLLSTGLALLAMQVTYLMSGERTVMAHATIFTNLTPFMLVLLRVALRQKVHKLEVAGTALALLGCVITV